MAEFLANESGADLVAQFQSSIRAGIRRTDTGVTHAAISVQDISLRSQPPSKDPVYLKWVVVSELFGDTGKHSTERTAVAAEDAEDAQLPHVTPNAKGCPQNLRPPTPQSRLTRS